MKKHWRTSLIGGAAMLLGIWSFHVHWNPTQTLYFNLVYGEVAQIGLIVAGWIGLHAADHKNMP